MPVLLKLRKYLCASTRALARARILGDITISYCLTHMINKELLILNLCFVFVYFLT
jgi:hypothetical protein